MSSALAAAIREGRPWLDRFTRREYEKAFCAYMETYGEPCRREIEEVGDALPALAEALLTELEEGRRRAHFWNRGTQAFDEKQTVVKYFVPMLLELDQSAFADCLHEAWYRRWPTDGYEQASYEKLRKGFVNVILGITFKDKE